MFQSANLLLTLSLSLRIKFSAVAYKGRDSFCVLQKTG